MRLAFNGSYGISRAFGVYDPSAYSGYPGARHPGTDYGVPANTPLVAGMSGTVSVIDRSSTLKTGRGKEVIITNGNKQRKACHMNRIDVVNGQYVAEGDPIGLSGYTGYVLDGAGNVGTPGGAHLHDELLIDGIYVNLSEHLGGDEDMIQDNEPHYYRASDMHLRQRGKTITREHFRAAAVGNSWLRWEEMIADNPEATAWLETGMLGQRAIAENWQGQLTTLRAAVKARDDAIADSNKKIVDLMKQIADLGERPDAAQLKALQDQITALTQQMEKDQIEYDKLAAELANKKNEDAAADSGVRSALRALWRFITGKDS